MTSQVLSLLTTCGLPSKEAKLGFWSKKMRCSETNENTILLFFNFTDMVNLFFFYPFLMHFFFLKKFVDYLFSFSQNLLKCISNQSRAKSEQNYIFRRILVIYGVIVVNFLRNLSTKLTISQKLNIGKLLRASSQLRLCKPPPHFPQEVVKFL